MKLAFVLRDKKNALKVSTKSIIIVPKQVYFRVVSQSSSSHSAVICDSFR